MISTPKMIYDLPIPTGGHRSSTGLRLAFE